MRTAKIRKNFISAIFSFKTSSNVPPCSSVVRKKADITDGVPHKVYRIRKKVDITDGDSTDYLNLLQ